MILNPFPKPYGLANQRLKLCYILICKSSRKDYSCERLANTDRGVKHQRILNLFLLSEEFSERIPGTHCNPPDWKQIHHASDACAVTFSFEWLILFYVHGLTGTKYLTRATHAPPLSVRFELLVCSLFSD